MKKSTFLVEEELLVGLKIEAAKQRTTMAQIVNRLISRYLKERGKRG